MLMGHLLTVPEFDGRHNFGRFSIAMRSGIFLGTYSHQMERDCALTAQPFLLLILNETFYQSGFNAKTLVQTLEKI